jgi:hypothetical protein
MNTKLFRFFGLSVLVLLVSIAFSQTATAQCPMCRMTLESNLKSGGQAGSGMNSGIFYLLFTPYIMVGTVGYLWWKNRKKRLDLDGSAADADLSVEN